jgi:hypothetical protein
MRSLVVEPTPPVRRPHPPISRWGTLALGLLLLLQGTGKLVDPESYVDALATFRVFPASWLWSIAVVWLLAELSAGVLLLVAALGREPQRRSGLTGAWLALAIALSYLALLASAWSRDLAIANCTCFGGFLAQRLSPWVFAQEVSMISWCVWQLVQIGRWPGRQPYYLYLLPKW